MKYKVLNKIGEKGRLMEQPIFYEATSGSQYDTHGYSYLFARKQFEEIGQVMGLDKIVMEEDLKK